MTTERSHAAPSGSSAAPRAPGEAATDDEAVASHVVESKRGGGGYIRIMKVNLVDEMDILNELGNLIPEELSEREGNHLLQNLYENELISKREAQMMSLMMEKDTFPSNVKNAAEIRSNMMKKLIDNLKYR